MKDILNVLFKLLIFKLFTIYDAFNGVVYISLDKTNGYSTSFTKNGVRYILRNRRSWL